ncbi:MAG TPA: hypothetical protein VFU99_02280 [Gaiellaceae bacterium]|nr:hypothetical protein [Gaiellaceae bacterium]
MDGIYAAPSAQRGFSATTIRTALASLASIVGDVLVTGARGDDLERVFSSAPGAQFGALPSSSKQRLLDRGFRP